MKYDFDQVVNRRHTCSMKWDIDKAKDPDILSMWVADMDFTCARPIIDTLADKVKEGIFGYPYYGCVEYYDSIIRWYRDRYQWVIGKNDIQYSRGVVLSIISCIRAFSKEGNGIIIQPPVYYPFFKVIESNDRLVVENPLVNHEGYYTMDFDLLEKQAKEENNTMMILCSPHNPIGRVWRKDELQKVIDICERNHVVLVSDEIHCDLTRKGVTFVPIGNLTDNAVSCISPSKSFNMPGLAMSSVIIKDEMLKQGYIEQAFTKSWLGMANSFGVAGLMTAYTECDDWLEQVNEYIDGNMIYVDEFIKQHMPKVTFKIPEGTYLAWLDFRKYQISDEKINDLIEKRAKILLDEGIMFGKSGKGFQRINVACSRSVVMECMRRLREAFESIA
ncbi:MAG: pyridoxal phosphate-dependent aminotransferase [Clostridia bacterium]|nr:pyridoxal phosphate-dependent aminotransferase [Clostridia bacterium]